MLFGRVVKNLVQKYKCFFTNYHVISEADENKILNAEQETLITECQKCKEPLILTRIYNDNKQKKSYTIEGQRKYWWFNPDIQEENIDPDLRTIPYKQDKHEEKKLTEEKIYHELKGINVNITAIKDVEPSYEELTDLLECIRKIK